MTVPGGAAWPGGTNIVGGGITGGASPLARASWRLRSRMATIWCNVFGGTWMGRTPPGTTMQGTGPPRVSTRTTCCTRRDPGTGGSSGAGVGGGIVRAGLAIPHAAPGLLVRA